MAHSAGNSNVELVVVGDDVSVPHSRGKMVGRRCLAGITLGMSFSPTLILPFSCSQRAVTFCSIQGDPNQADIQYARSWEQVPKRIWSSKLS
jgi:hypothetical protein